MSGFPFSDYAADEKKRFSADISQELNEALNSKDTVRQADELNGTTGGWPYPPTRELLQLFEKVVDRKWKTIQKKYSFLKVTISVEAPKSKPPYVIVEAAYDGDYKGGISYSVRAGDTMASIAGNHYGNDCYATMLYEANGDSLGHQCKQLPAGFAIDIPRIFVPNWDKPPKSTSGPETKVKAVNILYPAIGTKIEKSESEVQIIPTPTFVVKVTYEVSGKLTAQKKGAIDASFNLKKYEAELKSELGPIGSAFTFGYSQDKGDVELSLSNSMVRGLSVTQKVTLKPGKLKITFGSKKVSFRYKQIAAEGELSISAELEIIPDAGRMFKKRFKAKEERSLRVPLTILVIGVAISVVILTDGAAAPAVKELIRYLPAFAS